MIYGFDNFVLDTEKYQLGFSDEPVAIEPLVFDLLVYLIERRNRVVTRGELLENLWKGKVVTDAALGARLRDARRAIHDSGTRQKKIKTVHGRGYQFIAAITELETEPSQSIEEPTTAHRVLDIPDEPSIAVLPFTNLGSIPEQDFFSDGITEDIITALSKINHLFVIASTSTFAYKGQVVDAGRVSREQGVRYVLEGSVRKSEDRVRVTAQLIDTSTGFHAWGERYDREVKDIFAVQDDITKNVTVALQVALTEGEQARVFASGTDSLEAWECVVRGKDLLERHVRESNFEACQLLEHALQLDPNYVTAMAYLGWTHWENARYGWGELPGISLDRAIEQGEAALALEPDNSDALALLAFCFYSRGDLENAQEMAEKAATLAPNHAYIIAISAAVLRQTGRYQEAISRIEKAMRLSPYYPAWYLMILGSTYHLLGDQESALAALRESVRREPESILLLPWFACALVASNQEMKASKVADDILRIEPGFSRENWTRPWRSLDSSLADRLSGHLEKAGLPV